MPRRPRRSRRPRARSERPGDAGQMTRRPLRAVGSERKSLGIGRRRWATGGFGRLRGVLMAAFRDEMHDAHDVTQGHLSFEGRNP